MRNDLSHTRVINLVLIFFMIDLDTTSFKNIYSIKYNDARKCAIRSTHAMILTHVRQYDSNARASIIVRCESFLE